MTHDARSRYKIPSATSLIFPNRAERVHGGHTLTLRGADAVVLTVPLGGLCSRPVTPGVSATRVDTSGHPGAIRPVVAQSRGRQPPPLERINALATVRREFEYRLAAAAVDEPEPMLEWQGALHSPARPGDYRGRTPDLEEP